MPANLPNNPDLERFRRDARRLQRAVREGVPEGLELVAAHHPDGVPADPGRFPLSAAQLVVARGYGFTSWPQLRGHLDLVEGLGRDPTRGPTQTSGDPAEDAPDAFCRMACLVYSDVDHPDRWVEAARLLAADPSLPAASIYAAAAAGDPEALAGHVRADPAAADREGGPFAWKPLLYLTFSRVAQVDAVAAAEVLLDAGADVDAGYLWQRFTPPFTALTGVFGEGEQGSGRQPRHPQEQGLARLLLSRGADPDDGQALYNRMFRPDDAHFELLFEFGLGRGDGVWARRLGSSTESVPAMMERQLQWAAEHGFDERLALLARRGWGPDVVLDGERTVAEVLAAAWSSTPAIHLARTAAQVQAAVSDGGDINALHEGRTALHDAAFAGEVELVRALLAAGADPGVRDHLHSNTPLGWAEHGCQAEVAELLRPMTGADTPP